MNCSSTFSIKWDYNSAMTAANFKNYLTDIEGVSGISTITANAFKDCTRLKNMYNTGWGYTITTLGDSAFSGCISLDGLGFFNLKSIGANALANCTAYLGFAETTYEYLQSIGSGAFSGCTVMRIAALPSSVSTIGANAFQNCSNLKIVTQHTSQPAGWNAFSKIEGSLKFTLKSASGTIIQLGGRNTHTCNVSVSIFGAVSFSGDGLSFNTNVNYSMTGGGPYTLTMINEFTKASGRDYSTHTFTFVDIVY